jgi:hypothetical protein
MVKLNENAVGNTRYDRLNFVKAPLTPVGYVGKGVRAALSAGDKIVGSTEHFDKVILKPGSAVLAALDAVGLGFPGLKGVKSAFDSASKFTNATNIFSAGGELTSYYSKDGKSFFETPNAKFSIKIGDLNVDFKRGGRGLLRAGHVVAAGKWAAETIGYGKYVGHFVQLANGVILPGAGLFADGFVALSSIANIIGNSLNAYRFDEIENKARTVKTVKDQNGNEIEIILKGMTAVRQEKWKARQLVPKALEDNNQSKLAELKTRYVEARVKLGADKVVAEDKWDNVIVNREIFDDVNQRASVRTIADRHVKYYEAKDIKVFNERAKSFVAIMYEIFKIAIISIAIVASAFALLALTPVIPFTPFFIVVGLLCSGFGAAKVFMEFKASGHAKKFAQIEDSFGKPPANLVNYHKEAYRELLVRRAAENTVIQPQIGQAAAAA